MDELDRNGIERYLKKAIAESVKLKQVEEIGAPNKRTMKRFGYGKSVRVTYKNNGREENVVFSTMRGDRYGHQFYWDRAAILMFEYDTGCRMEKHIKPAGLGYVDDNNALVPVESPREFFIINELIEGETYHNHLERINSGSIYPEDGNRVREFARWLARIHAQKYDSPDLYLRRIRQLIGDSECIWGLIDAYPYPYEYFSPESFQEMEKALIDWRWKLRGYTRRLAVTHGDFHPWNVLIRPDGDFAVLDRSRGEWGEPADDIASMSSNYLLYGLYRNGRLAGDFEDLFNAFWKEYLEATGDNEIAEVISPFYVFRCLVLANPEWYPDHPLEVRQALLRFAENILSVEYFDYRRINEYLLR